MEEKAYPACVTIMPFVTKQLALHPLPTTLTLQKKYGILEERVIDKKKGKKYDRGKVPI